jgi:ubiquitin C-terminal hydrolase
MSDDEFIRWDIQYLPEPTGFPNFGNTCYLNSMLQTLISCPAIMQVLKTIENTNPEQYQNNPIVNSLLNLWKKTLDKTAVADDVKSFWRAMLIVARSKNDRVKIDMGGQQDPHEGLMMCLVKLTLFTKKR